MDIVITKGTITKGTSLAPLPPHTLRTVGLTTLALVAFAANSVLCRLALQDHTIDAGSFTAIRLAAGSAVLMALVYARAKQHHPTPTSTPRNGRWLSGAMLFIYAVAFSYGYIHLSTATGALVLFGTVQLTMLFSTILKGHRLKPREWLGMAVAIIGFIGLLVPDVKTPSALGFLLMCIAGIAWAIYTLNGRNSTAPLTDTAINFLRTLPFALPLVALTSWYSHITYTGIILAVLSGGIASGLGYAVWYKALQHLNPTQAGVVQLLVPAIAAMGGVTLANEQLTLHITCTVLLILGGVFVVITTKKETKAHEESGPSEVKNNCRH